MEFVALAIALIGLAAAWIANRKNKMLEERLSKANSKIYYLRQESLETQEKLQQELTALKFEMMRSNGTLQVTGGMTLEEVQMVHPQAEQVLAGFHIGGCASCSYDGDQRLDLAAASSGQQLEPILVALNTLVKAGKNGEVPEAVLKTPNVQLSL